MHAHTQADIQILVNRNLAGGEGKKLFWEDKILVVVRFPSFATLAICVSTVAAPKYRTPPLLPSAPFRHRGHRRPCNTDEYCQYNSDFKITEAWTPNERSLPVSSVYG